MNRGALAQVAQPHEMYEQPNSRWVAEFIGDVNLLEGRVRKRGPSGTVVETAAAGVVRAAPCVEAVVGAAVWVALRPEKVGLTLAPSADELAGHRVGEVTGVGYLGDLVGLPGAARRRGGLQAALANVRRRSEEPIRPGAGCG